MPSLLSTAVRYIEVSVLDKEKKQVPLRISAKLYEELQRWADDEFRSINGQIEYLLTECVRKNRNKRYKDE